MSKKCSNSKGCVKEGFVILISLCVYLDDLSNKLSNVNAGCIIASSLINHYIAYVC